MQTTMRDKSGNFTSATVSKRKDGSFLLKFKNGDTRIITNKRIILFNSLNDLFNNQGVK